MRRSDLYRVWPLSLLLASASLVHGQAPRNLPAVNSGNASKSAEAARVLERAKSNRQADSARFAEGAAAARRLQAEAAKAKAERAAQPSYAERTNAASSEKRLQDAMSRVSPEGKAILTQSGAAPTLRAPSDSLGTGSSAKSQTKASPLSTDGPGPKPQPLKPTPLVSPVKQPVPTVIVSESSFFDSREGFGVFVGDVVLDHPEFHLTSDELEVYMHKEQKPAESADPNAPPTPPALPPGPTAGQLAEKGAATDTTKGPAPSERKMNDNLKKAIAKGRKVVINKLSPEGDPQIGTGQEAEYDGDSGDVILRGMPQIQNGRNLQVAIDPTTYFVIKRDGRFSHHGGRAQTRIIQEDEKKKAAPPASGTSPAAPAPVIGNKTQGGQQ
jgi:lipopolysaccharide export system protein LptA